MAGKVSKMEAVRQAIRGLGKDAMPVEIQTFVKQKFGLAMSTAHVSNYKTDILRKQSGKASQTAMKPLAPKMAAPKAPKMAPPKMAPAPVALKAPSANHVGGISLDDIETVSELLGRNKGSDLKGLIEVLLSK